MKLGLVFLSLFFVLKSQARENDFICKGKLDGGKNISIIYDEWADNRQSTRVDLTVNVQGVGPRTTLDLYAYAPSDDGDAYDFGVTNTDASMMFHVYLPPNMLPGKQVLGILYDKNLTTRDGLKLKCQPYSKR